MSVTRRYNSCRGLQLSAFSAYWVKKAFFMHIFLVSFVLNCNPGNLRMFFLNKDFFFLIITMKYINKYINIRKAIKTKGE